MANVRFVVAGLVVLAVAMGVGRFAYTPLLPLMLDSAGLSHAMAGIVASSNLAGYFVGALSASSAAFRTKRLAGVWFAIAGVIVTTAIMASASLPIWLIARFLTGVGSGFAFVLASGIVLDRAAAERRPDWVAIFYGGVGVGIVLTGVAVPLLGATGGWRAGWLGLAAISAAISALALPGLRDHLAGRKPHEDDPEGARDSRLFPWLLLAYGGQGFGYIIPATFIVAMIAGTPSLAAFATLSWIVVGVVAIPSTILWNRLGITLGRDRALVFALLVLGAGTIAPIVAPNAFGVVVAAATLGGTFIGITALANALGRQLFPHHSHVAIGQLTAVFGVGQIIGPAAAGALAGATGGYAIPLMTSAAVSCASALAMLCGVVFAGGARSDRLRMRSKQ